MRRIAFAVVVLAVGTALMGAKGCGTTQNAYGDGMYDVGVSLPPGLYHTPGKGRRHPCFWSVERGNHKTEAHGFAGASDLRVYKNDRAYSFKGGCVWHKVG